jgi:hypothetical protein
MTLGIKILSIMTFSIMTLVIKTKIMTLLGQISQFISQYNQPTLRHKENHTRYNDTVIRHYSSEYNGTKYNNIQHKNS